MVVSTGKERSADGKADSHDRARITHVAQERSDVCSETCFGPAALIIYGTTIFLGAILLFAIEPLVGKSVLPVLGGSPSVWNTCVFFFQIILLTGYAYAHLITTRFRFETQFAVHSTLLILATGSLPFGIIAGQPDSSIDPALWLLICLALSVGLPFFAVSATNPILQSWFSRMNTRHSKDPYFLYAASNLGSLVGVAIYPAFIEQYIPLSLQGRSLSNWYLCLVLLIGVCGATVLASRTNGHEPVERTDLPSGDYDLASVPSVIRQLRWICLAAVPSSLMLGLTTFVTADMASLPLFWAVPLSLYLLSFVVMFSSPPNLVLRLFKLMLPWCVLASFAILTSTPALESYRLCQTTVLSGLTIHLVTLFVVSCVCHGEIYCDRPNTKLLTKFYMLISIGGVIGSSLNAFVAPLIFRTAIEFPLVLGLSAVLLSTAPALGVRAGLASTKFGIKLLSAKSFSNHQFVIALFCVAGLCLSCYRFETYASLCSTGLDLPYRIALSMLVLIGPAIVVSMILARNAMQLRCLLLLVLVVAVFDLQMQDPAIYRSRDFFGCLSLRLNKEGTVIEQWSGPTRHGQQYLDPDLRNLPTSYYSQSGPCGLILKQLPNERSQSIAVIGLGVGTLASYARKGDQITFFEIDPDVIRIAEQPMYFTYLSSARRRSADVKIVQGDGRIKIGETKDNSYDAIIIDAFSSDFIPGHLLTREALTIYRKKLKERGFILFHLSNRYYDLKPEVGKLISAGAMNALYKNDSETNEEKDASEWMAATQDDATTDKLLSLGFEAVLPKNDKAAWCDDLSNPLGSLRRNWTW